MAIEISGSVLLVKPDGTFRAESLRRETGETCLPILQRLVGEGTGADAMVDVVRLAPDLDMWIDDEGMYRPSVDADGESHDPVVNGPASIVAALLGFSHQPYYGNAVFTGGADDEGDTVGLRPEVLEKLTTLHRHALRALITGH